jgi:hypothetical protein
MPRLVQDQDGSPRYQWPPIRRWSLAQTTLCASIKPARSTVEGFSLQSLQLHHIVYNIQIRANGGAGSVEYNHVYFEIQISIGIQTNVDELRTRCNGCCGDGFDSGDRLAQPGFARQ